MSNQTPNDPPRFQVRPSPNRPGGYWEAFDTAQPHRLVMAATLNQQEAYAEAERLNRLHTAEKKHTGRNIFLGIGAGFVLLIGAAVLSPSEPAKQAADKLPNVVTTTTSATTAPPAPKATPTQPPKTTAPVVEPTVEVTTEKPSMTTSQEQAIGSAESYLEFKAFSRKGLIQQLSSEYGEGFSKADATYAVDHITVNWNEQAAESARQYLEMQHFSRSGLIQQLESSAGEGFTHKQAVYGVSKAGL